MTMLLGPFTTICSWYIAMYFFSVPKKEDSAEDIEKYFISKAPRWSVFLGLIMLVAPFSNLTMDSDVSMLFISASIQAYLGGLLMIVLGVTASFFFSRFGVRRFTPCMVGLALPWILVTILNSFYTLS